MLFQVLTSTYRLREGPTEEDSSMVSDSGNKKQKMNRKIDIADRVSYGLVGINRRS